MLNVLRVLRHTELGLYLKDLENNRKTLKTIANNEINATIVKYMKNYISM